MNIPTTQRTFVSWHSADDLPDSEITVLVHCMAGDEEVWLGYHDGEVWRDVDGADISSSRVAHWAHLPEPPGGET